MVIRESYKVTYIRLPQVLLVLKDKIKSIHPRRLKDECFYLCAESNLTFFVSGSTRTLESREHCVDAVHDISPFCPGRKHSLPVHFESVPLRPLESPRK